MAFPKKEPGMGGLHKAGGMKPPKLPGALPGGLAPKPIAPAAPMMPPGVPSTIPGLAMGPKKRWTGGGAPGGMGGPPMQGQGF